MKISLITTSYNREKTIRDAIESVLAQSYADIEHIIVDGMSKDKTMSVVNEYKDSVAKIVSEKDSGMYEAINKGIRMSTGDVIGLLHSDDVFFSKNTISDIMAFIQKTGADLVYGNGFFVDYDDLNKVVRDWVSGEFDASNLRYGWLPLHTTVFIKRECFDRLGLYNEDFKISADSDFLLRYLSDSKLKISYLNKYIVKMRMGGLSTSFLRTRQKWGEDFRLYKSHGMNPYFSLLCKVFSKIPQFIKPHSVFNF